MDTEKLKFIIFGVAAIIIIVIVLGLLGVLPIFKSKLSAKKVDLEIWGVFDEKEVSEPIISNFRSQNKNFTIKYTKKSLQTYEKDLVNALAAGTGPDIFMIHNSWLPKHIDKLYPAPYELITIRDYKNDFVDVVYNDFVSEDQIYALPLYVDSLALVYNKDIFNSSGLAEPPETWEDLVNIVPMLVRKNDIGDIVRPAIALGTARNISHSKDILMLLMLQNGTKMVDLNRNEAMFDKSFFVEGKRVYPGEDALRFYTDFANPSKSIYSWNNQMDFSIDMFSQNRLAMMFIYSYQIDTLLNKNPNLNFGISKMPQLKNTSKVINFADYWGFAVANSSENPFEAWQFLKFLGQKENLYQYLQYSNRPSPRRDLIKIQKDDPQLGVFATQALSATSWYQVDNVAIGNIFVDMIESIIGGNLTYNEAIKKAADQITVLMNK